MISGFLAAIVFVTNERAGRIDRPQFHPSDSDGRKLYAANGLSNDISVIDTVTGRLIATVKAGDGPWGIVVRP